MGESQERGLVPTTVQVGSESESGENKTVSPKAMKRSREEIDETIAQIYAKFDVLPKDVLLYMISYLPIADRLQLCQTDAKFARFCKQHSLTGADIALTELQQLTPESEVLDTPQKQLDLVRRGFNTVYTVIFNRVEDNSVGFSTVTSLSLMGGYHPFYGSDSLLYPISESEGDKVVNHSPIVLSVPGLPLPKGTRRVVFLMVETEIPDPADVNPNSAVHTEYIGDLFTREELTAIREEQNQNDKNSKIYPLVDYIFSHIYKSWMAEPPNNLGEQGIYSHGWKQAFHFYHKIYLSASAKGFSFISHFDNNATDKRVYIMVQEVEMP